MFRYPPPHFPQDPLRRVRYVRSQAAPAFAGRALVAWPCPSRMIRSAFSSHICYSLASTRLSVGLGGGLDGDQGEGVAASGEHLSESLVSEVSDLSDTSACLNTGVQPHYEAWSPGSGEV